MSRIGLVNLVPLSDIANYLGFNHGIGSLSAVLKRAGHVTCMATISSVDDDMAHLEAFEPDALFVYLATNQRGLFIDLLSGPWAGYSAQVFAGGPHPTICPEETAQMEGVAGICIGEGENTALAVADRLDTHETLHGVPNLWFQEEGELVKGSVGDFVVDLDTLPFPDRDIFPYEEMLKSRAINLMGFEFLATRGCIYGCKYCINPLLRKIHGKGCVRRRSFDHFLAEITAVVDRYDYKGIIGIHDDIFTLDKEWLEGFSHGYQDGIGLPFWCNAHIAELSEDIIRQLRQAGCFRVHVGIECGNEKTRAIILGKHIANEEILEKVRMLRAHHIKLVTTFMIGLPDEDEAGLLETIDLCRQIAPDWVLLSTFCPYPGTRLYTELVKERRLDPDFYKSLGSETFYSANSSFDGHRIPQEKLTYYFNNFRKMAGVIR